MHKNELVLNSEDSKILQNLCGPMDNHIKQIADHFAVEILRHDDRFQINGHNSESAINSLKHFYALAKTRELDAKDIQNGLTAGNYSFNEDVRPASRSSTKSSDIRGLTPNQDAYLDAIANNDITFGIGPAGTGKTYLSVAAAVRMFEREEVKRLVLVRPAVEAGEKLGFLPGDLSQKVDPYLRPIYDALHSLMGFEKTTKLIEKNIIEIAPLAFMRGRTLNDAFIILDEAQNTTPEQMKMFLTRLGFGSKVVVTGDITQIDLPKTQPSGLVVIEKILKDIKGICFHHLTKDDVVRHPLVQKIVEAYEKYKP